jgi:hypothetical protein
MAVAMYMHWPGVTSDQYDAVMARLGLDANPPAGGVLHMATVTDEGVEIYDIWQTEQAFNGFLEQRLLPVVSELGISGEPDVRVVPLHNLYAADPDMIDRIGAVSFRLRSRAGRPELTSSGAPQGRATASSPVTYHDTAVIRRGVEA